MVTSEWLQAEVANLWCTRRRNSELGTERAARLTIHYSLITIHPSTPTPPDRAPAPHPRSASRCPSQTHSLMVCPCA